MSVIAQGIDATRQTGREVARYRVPGGQRVVYAHEVTGGQWLVDVPATGVAGQLFTVDMCWRDPWGLEGFLQDYVMLGERFGCCPVRPDLEELVVDEDEFDEGLIELYWRIGRS